MGINNMEKTFSIKLRVSFRIKHGVHSKQPDWSCGAEYIAPGTTPVHPQMGRGSNPIVPSFWNLAQFSSRRVASVHSCSFVNEYNIPDNGGNVWTSILHPASEAWIIVSRAEKSSWCRNEQAYHGVLMCKTLWVLQITIVAALYIITYYVLT